MRRKGCRCCDPGLKKGGLIGRLVMSLPNIAGQMGQCGGASMEKTAMKKTPSSKSQLGKKKKLPLALSGTMNRYFFLSVFLSVIY